MRILEVTESFATGTMEVVRLVSEGAAREGHQVAIAYGKRPETPQDLREVVSSEVELIRLPWTKRTLPMQLRSARALRNLGRAWNPDVVHLHSSFAGLLGALTLASRAPTVYTPHSYSFLGATSPAVARLYRLAEGFIVRRVAMIGAVSQHEARLARELGARRVEVVPNGIPEFDRPAGFGGREPSPRRPSVVAAGRIVRQRRPLATAGILSRVSDIADIVWIGGPGPDAELALRIQELGVPATGWLPRDEAARRISQATVLLHWSEWDSHPLTVLEALAGDALVIGSDIESNREMLGDEQVCATEADAVDLVRAVLQDARLRSEMLERQRQRRARFGAKRMIRDWLRIYSDLAQVHAAEVAPAPDRALVRGSNA